jgi:hypothetical protein
MEEEKELTPLQIELFTLLDTQDIDDIVYDACLVAFSTDKALQNAIDWIKKNPEFSNKEISKIITKFGIESDEFTTHVEVDDE